MKENDSGKENNYTLICVWQLCFIPLAHKAKIKGDIVESVLSAFNGVGHGLLLETGLFGLAFSWHGGAAFCAPLTVAGQKEQRKGTG